MRFALILMLPLIAVGTAIYVSKTASKPLVPKTMPLISIRLLGSTKDITGINIPLGYDDRKGEYLRCNEPCKVTLFMPEESEKRTSAKYVSAYTQLGTVTDVDILPFPETLPYKEAIIELNRLLAEFKIVPDEKMHSDMTEKWPDDVPGFDFDKRPGFHPLKNRTGMRLSAEVSLTVELKPSVDGGWFARLSFQATGERRKAIRKQMMERYSTSQPSAKKLDN